MEINRDNRTVQKFKDVGIAYNLDEINKLYVSLSPDIKFLSNLLTPVISEFILCPSNGTWRCVATVGARENQVAIFFPWIFSKIAPATANPPAKIALGISGDVGLEKISHFCNEITRVLEEEHALRQY